MSAPQSRPNILILMSDEHRHDLAGFAGNTIVRTPVLDELARTGVVFENAYTPSPICIPARQSIMAGQYPSTTGCRRFDQDLSPGYLTYARWFAQHAYSTTCSGKLHHTGWDQMQGWTTRLHPDARVANHFVENRRQDEAARYAKVSGTGKWSNQREIERARPGRGPYQLFDERAVEASIEYLDAYFGDPLYDRPSSAPLLFKLSLLQPHYPFVTEEEKFRYYLNRVSVFEEQRSDHPVLSRTQAWPPDITASRRDLQRATAAYYGMVETIDNHYGRVLDRLSFLGQNLDDWLIIYLSDHGDMLGEHGVWEKASFYEGSVKVPLIVRWPSRFKGGTKVSQNVSLCDLFATLCDCAGLETPFGLDGRSLLPLLQGDEIRSEEQDEVLSQIEMDGVPIPEENPAELRERRLMIKSGNLKYMYFGADGPEVLFDLSSDPNELTNVANEEKYRSAMAHFNERRTSLGYF